MSFNPEFKIFPAGIRGIILFLIRAFKYSEYVDIKWPRNMPLTQMVYSYATLTAMWLGTFEKR